MEVNDLLNSRIPWMDHVSAGIMITALECYHTRQKVFRFYFGDNYCESSACESGHICTLSLRISREFDVGQSSCAVFVVEQ